MNRIYFKDNPWPEGHSVQQFNWFASIHNGFVWFDFHLKTEDYYFEREIEYQEDIEYSSGWAAPIVWRNYHSYTLSSNYWHQGGFKVCSLSDYSPEFLDGLQFEIDPKPENIDDWDNLVFHIYLLGHDSLAKHKIRFERVGESLKFKISWPGKIAQTFVGDYEYKHDFNVIIKDELFPKINKIV